MKPVRTKLSAYLLCASTLLLSNSCGLIYDDIEPCTETYHISFVYDCNLLWADAFAHEVKAVDVWAYDPDGNLVWNDKVSGDRLSEKGFSLVADLSPGEYTFLCWGGLTDDTRYELTTNSPTNLKSMGMTLTTSTEDDIKISDAALPPLYHGLKESVELVPAIDSHVVQYVEIPLVRDTKSIVFTLQNSNGDEIDPDNFSVSITADNLNLGYDNEFLESPIVEYRPYHISQGSIDANRAKSTVSTLMYSFDVNRLETGSGTRLKVVRLSDNTEIINIPLVDYFLLYKEEKYNSLSDREYLDRESNYNMVLLLDNNSNWNIAAGIIINNWAIVPPQIQN